MTTMTMTLVSPMARGGPGSVSARKLPAGWPRTDPFIVWSWWQDRWWRVDGGADPTVMRTSALSRMRVCRDDTPRPFNPSGTPYNLDARFVATDRDGDPETEWQASQG